MNTYSLLNHKYLHTHLHILPENFPYTNGAFMIIYTYVCLYVLIHVCGFMCVYGKRNSNDNSRKIAAAAAAYFVTVNNNSNNKKHVAIQKVYAYLNAAGWQQTEKWQPATTTNNNKYKMLTIATIRLPLKCWRESNTCNMPHNAAKKQQANKSQRRQQPWQQY